MTRAMTGATMPAMIRLEQVSKSFRRDGVTKHILHDVSFDLPPGRNIAILGRNGAGKSTLMRLIAGTLRPDRGQILRRCRISWPMGFAGFTRRADLRRLDCTGRNRTPL